MKKQGESNCFWYKLLLEVSTYATREGEGLAECVADFDKNGNNSTRLSKEINRILRGMINGSKYL